MKKWEIVRFEASMFTEIVGQSIIIKAFWIEHRQDTLAIKMKCMTENCKVHFIIFNNVSKLMVKDISYPFKVDGFEIIDNSSRGFQRDCRYLVQDYEDGLLSFVCENFEIFNTADTR